MTFPPPIRWLAGAAAAAAVGLTLSGCQTSAYEVKVDAIAKRAPSGAAGEPQSFKIRSKNPEVGEESLRYKEAAEFVKTALSAKGLYEAPSIETADMVVDLDYGMAAPRTKLEMVSSPVYAQVGGGVRYETVPVTDARGNTTMRTVAVYQQPRSELVGFDEVPRQITIYEKYLKVSARENKPGVEGKPPAELWSVQASTEDESKDLRKYLPIMASTTADYIGKDTTKQKVVKVKENAQGVEFIRKGMGDSPTGGPQTAPPTNPRF